jgi:hypothetical protein
MATIAAFPAVGYLKRLKLVAFGGLAGWLAGILVSLPAEILIGIRDVEGQPRLMAASLTMGIAVWIVWTLALAAAAWLIIAVPSVLIFTPGWLVRFRSRVLWFTAGSALCVCFIELFPFRDYATAKLDYSLQMFSQYGAFAIAFSVITAWLYIRLVQRIPVSA